MDRSPKNCVSFRISHPSWDPARITEALGVEPKITRHAGAPRTTPTGAPLEGHWKNTHWIGPTTEGKGDFEDRLADYAESLLPHRAFFEEIVRTGGHMDFFIGWFPDDNSAIVLPPELLRMIGELGIELQFDMYVPPWRKKYWQRRIPKKVFDRRRSSQGSP